MERARPRPPRRAREPRRRRPRPAHRPRLRRAERRARPLPQPAAAGVDARAARPRPPRTRARPRARRPRRFARAHGPGAAGPSRRPGRAALGSGRVAHREIHSWLMDMDGVLVHEESAIPGADRFLAALRERGRPFLVLTNNSIYTR